MVINRGCMQADKGSVDASQPLLACTYISENFVCCVAPEIAVVSYESVDEGRYGLRSMIFVPQDFEL